MKHSCIALADDDLDTSHAKYNGKSGESRKKKFMSWANIQHTKRKNLIRKTTGEHEFKFVEVDGFYYLGMIIMR